MVAINLATGTTFDVISTSKQNFVGRCIQDTTSLYEKGKRYPNLSKKAHALLLEWNESDRIIKTLLELQKKFR